VDDWIDSLERLDWSNVQEMSTVTGDILRSMAANLGLVQSLLESLPQSEKLLSMCEHYDLLDKLVLFYNERYDYRLRLHVFLPGYFDRPHNHRWSYSSIVLRGSYKHFIYGQDEGLSDQVDVDSLQPVMVHQPRAGDVYTLHHSMIHSVIAEPYTVTLILRGPAQKDRFVVMDRLEKRAWWQYGMAQETAQERSGKVMTRDYFESVRAGLKDLLFS
jgi:predicted metal-dependent enzyme (double-stranded beta helix superfamily)